MPADRRTVLVTSRSFGSGRQDPESLLDAGGLDVVRGAADHDMASLSGPLGEAVAWVAGTGPITAAHLDAAPNLRVIARYGTGTDSVDLAAARARDVVVTFTPGANAEGVADLAVALILAAVRHLLAGDRALRSGSWPALRGRELSALTVGIVGLGRIGRGLARRLRGGFGAEIVGYDPFVTAADVVADGIQWVELDELLVKADVVSLHIPGDHRPVIDARALGVMRPGAVLVNTARATAVDEQAVAAALSSGALGALATDVLATEPDFAGPLRSAPNVIVTPHLGAQTVESIDRMGMAAAEDVIRVLAGQPPAHPVSTGGPAA